ncbi:MAG: AfsR/SARP family transcriptional regulator, partial [Anaerolineales bacterium]
MIRIHLLGRFEVIRGEKILRAPDWPRRKAAALLQRLALSRRLLKDEAIDYLWPDSDTASGANNLYRTLHVLRQTLDHALGPDAAGATLAFEDGTLTLHNSVWVDAAEFEKQVSLAVSNPPPPISDLESTLRLYSGDLLPDEFYADWAAAPREALRRLQREGQLALARGCREARDFHRAIAALTPLLARDRADEAAHRELMRTYALAGRRHDALRQYQACAEARAAELDVPPEPETAALFAHILSGELTPPMILPGISPSAPSDASV